MRTVVPDDTWTLKQTRDWLREWLEDGVACPCCQQMAKIYHRQVNAAAVRGLIAIYHATRDGSFAHLPSIGLGRLGGEAARLSYWGLIEEERDRREDGGRTGWWRITDQGIDWLHGRIAIRRYARVYNRRLLGLHGELVYVSGAVKKDFDLRELMEGEGE